MWNNEAVKAYESGQGVVLVEKPYPHYEPVAWMNQNGVVRKVGYEWGPNNTLTALYATPPQRTWVGLTDEEIENTLLGYRLVDAIDIYRSIESKLRSKNDRND